MVQRAIAVFLAVGLHSGDAAVPAVAYEHRGWDKSQDCSGPPDYVFRYPLEICREVSVNYDYLFERQINDTNLGVIRSQEYRRFPCDFTGSDEKFRLMGSASCTSVSSAPGSWGYFWVYSKDLAV